MKFIFSFVLLVSLLGLLIAKSVKEAKAVTPVTAEVYFTATNDDAIKVFDNQNMNKPDTVWPLMLSGKKDLLLNFYPWGKATKEGTTYTCPGETNCLQTRLLACAIKMHKNTDAEKNHVIFHFLVCLVSHSDFKTNPSHAVDMCNGLAAPEWVEDFGAMKLCSTTEATSDPFLDEMKKATDDAAMAKDLAIKIKGKDGEDEFAKESLLGAVCLAYDGDKPEECKDAPTPGPISEATTAITVPTTAATITEPTTESTTELTLEPTSNPTTQPTTPSTEPPTTPNSAQDIISNKFFGFALILIAMIAIL